ncbi:hypothetical protein FB567DRAFT_524577 [Paraphoma chrysanthemicola]|uniref:Uncharacterized protein n=1 Tax=Paraphoma chrysanthemicola TaxID=798071 RepID=A0A8K0RA57_9PLEO|nr:hypothetical protein FB567DRAFT_524577 [Paraphoma chrysanthemicola]
MLVRDARPRGWQQLAGTPCFVSCAAGTSKIACVPHVTISPARCSISLDAAISGQGCSGGSTLRGVGAIATVFFALGCSSQLISIGSAEKHEMITSSIRLLAANRCMSRLCQGCETAVVCQHGTVQHNTQVASNQSRGRTQRARNPRIISSLYMVFDTAMRTQHIQPDARRSNNAMQMRIAIQISSRDP